MLFQRLYYIRRTTDFVLICTWSSFVLGPHFGIIGLSLQSMEDASPQLCGCLGLTQFVDIVSLSIC